MIQKLLKSALFISIILLFVGCGAKNCGCGLTSEVDTSKKNEKPTSIQLEKTENAR